MTECLLLVYKVMHNCMSKFLSCIVNFVSLPTFARFSYVFLVPLHMVVPVGTIPSFLVQPIGRALRRWVLIFYLFAKSSKLTQKIHHSSCVFFSHVPFESLTTMPLDLLPNSRCSLFHILFTLCFIYHIFPFKQQKIQSLMMQTTDTYYRRSSSAQYVGNVAVPLLCISALDDPVCTREAIPWDECR